MLNAILIRDKRTESATMGTFYIWGDASTSSHLTLS